LATLLHSGVPLPNVRRNQKQRGRAGLLFLPFCHVVLAVEDEGGDTLAAHAVFDP